MTLARGSMDELVKLSFFVDIGRSIAQAKTIEDTLAEVMRHVGDIFTPLDWSLLLKDPQTGDLTFTVVIGKNASKLQGKRLPQGEGIAGWICENAQPVIAEDVASDERFSCRIDQYTQFETKSIIGVPLKVDDRVIGVIELINKINGQAFTPFELKILTTIADFAAIAIERAYFSRALKKMATEDALTGVKNRRTMEQVLAQELSKAKRYGTSLSLLMVDVDAFKTINDTYGHLAGDQVLKKLAQIIVDTVREVDTVCRFGGDEFVVIMPNTSASRAETVRTRIQEAIDYHNSLGGEIQFRCSIGLHSVDSGAQNGLLAMLDSDLYRQKRLIRKQNLHDVEQNLEAMLAEEKQDRRADRS